MGAFLAFSSATYRFTKRCDCRRLHQFLPVFQKIIRTSLVYTEVSFYLGVVHHPGITFHCSKRLKSQLYSPPLALSCLPDFIVASRGYSAPLAEGRCSWSGEMGAATCYESSTAEKTRNPSPIHRIFLRRRTKALATIGYS